jgi:predicted RNase H-related nuclease YkuK (DUF458 family)
MIFYSPTRGALTFDAVFRDIVAFLKESPEAEHKLIVGTDSHAKDDQLFVTAIILHRLGKGARYYYKKTHHRKMKSLRQKLFWETSLSLQVAGQLAERLSEQGLAGFNVEIHCDVGPHGSTRELIREIVGMVSGSGFDAKIKPNSYGASKVADKHTR